jgi:hypothetical protein
MRGSDCQACPTLAGGTDRELPERLRVRKRPFAVVINLRFDVAVMPSRVLSDQIGQAQLRRSAALNFGLQLRRF